MPPEDLWLMLHLLNNTTIKLALLNYFNWLSKQNAP